MERTNRRHVLATTAGVLATSIAGCSSGDDTTEEPTDEPTDEPTEEPTDEPTDEPTEEPTDTATTTGSGVTTISVGPGGSFRFAPTSVTVAVGDTVEWFWASGGHNVVVESAPDDSEWTGSEGAPTQTFSSGHTHTHTFEMPGTYSYYCNPHRSAGMTGEVIVEE